jgi:periplasmic mercuric ion binding protein
MKAILSSLLFVIATSTAWAAERSVTYAVENMTCATCPLTIKTAIKRLDGVKSVDVDFDKKTATVVFDDEKVTESTIANASRDAGFPAKAVH